MPEPVESYDPEGVDYGWVMQTTFVVTILVGAPLVGAVSATTPLQTWAERAAFAVRVGAGVWFLTAICVFAYAVYADDENDATESDESATGEETNPDGEDHATPDGRDPADE